MSQAAKGAGTGAASGAASGAAMGTMIMPGWGTAIGAGVGAIAGGLSGYFGGKSKDDANRKKNEAWKKAQATLDQSRREQVAARGLLVQQAYSPLANAMNSMYGQNIDLSNPLTKAQKKNELAGAPATAPGQNRSGSFSPEAIQKASKGKK